MSVSRRAVLGGMAVAGASHLGLRGLTLAQDSGTPVAVGEATPVAVQSTEPGYGIIRLRALPTAELNQAVFPHVMHRYLPAIEAVPGFAGYVFAFHDEEPGTSITLNLTTDEAAGAASDEAAASFVAGLDPRLAVETPVNEEGPLRIYGFTDRPASELPLFLQGCKFTARIRETAPGADIEAVITQSTDVLLPMLAGMEGFVMYAWILLPTARVAINIWETAEQMAAGDQAVADYVAQNTAPTTTGDPIVHNGTIGYATF